MRKIHSVVAELFIFKILWGRLSLEVVFISRKFWFWYGRGSMNLKYKEDPISGCWDVQLLLFWGRLPSSPPSINLKFKIWGRLHFKKFLTLVWSHMHKCKIWGISDQCLMRYSTFNILRSSSIGGRLHFKKYLSFVW